jgi:hypothetical protein
MHIIAFKEIRKAIADAVPEVRWTDLDRGQLQKPEAFDTPVMSNTVLLKFEPIQWDNLTYHNQIGHGIMTAKVLVRLPDGQMIDEEQDGNLEALMIENDVHLAILGIGGIVRLSSDSSVQKTLFVTEHTYNVRYEYESGLAPTTQKLPKPQIEVTLKLPHQNP